MNAYYWLYHSLIGVALLLAIWAYLKGHRHYKYLIILLSVTLIVELIAEVILWTNGNFIWLYHTFVVIEYSLLCLYYLHTDGSKRKWPVLSSIPLFIAFSISVSVFLYRFIGFPGININAEGLLIFILYSNLLFNLEVGDHLPLYRKADFWISISLLLFFGGSFIANGIYSPLLRLSTEQAVKLFGLINKPLNIILYGGFIIGILCSIVKKRSI